MLGITYLAQHRFADAVREAARARDMNPLDAANYGVLGDGYLELGEYDKAFDAFEQMMKRRPNAAAYARASYARELQGDLAAALEFMTMAANATTGHDQESQAWHYAQIGNLYFQMGRLAEARREFRRAEATFPGHPYALTGLAKVEAAEGRLDRALAMYEQQLERAATPELAASAGDLHARLGRADAAEEYYATAERLEREGWEVEEPQPAALARFLAERDRAIPQALELARAAARERRDIHTLDALAWSQFKAGQIADASATIGQALRTGTRDRRILYHAAEIRRAAGDRVGARELVTRALDGHPAFDPIAAPAAARLLRELS
jgi:tetratricopeptide (TPR) repeat protein